MELRSNVIQKMEAENGMLSEILLAKPESRRGKNGIGIRKGNEENRQGILEPPEMAELTELNRAN